MAKKFDMRFTPHAEYRFWLHDPEGNGMTYYRTAQDRDEHAKQVIDGYLEEVWAEGVEHICAGEVTHIAQVLDKTMRPDDLDEDGVDGEGNYWEDDMEWRGNYTLEPIGASGEASNG